MGLKMLRPNKAAFGDPFGLDLLPEIRQQTHLTKVFDSQKSDKISSETNIKNLKAEEISVKASVASEPHPEETPPLNYYLHVFYYSWYGNPQFDGKYIHWNHPVLSHWDPQITKKYPKGKHNPPDEAPCPWGHASQSMRELLPLAAPHLCLALPSQPEKAMAPHSSTFA